MRTQRYLTFGVTVVTAIEELIANALDWRTKSEQIEAPVFSASRESNLVPLNHLARVD